MDTNDIPSKAVPARLTMARRPLPGLRGTGAPVPSAPALLNTHVVFRGLTRHWLKLLVVWAVASAGLILLIQARVKPVYEASSMLRVEPNYQDLFGLQIRAGEVFGAYLSTQVRLMTTPNVISAAAAEPEVAALPRIAAAADAEAELRSLVVASIESNTFLIKVSVRSESPTEASQIVNAVVKSYLKTNDDWSTTANLNLVRKLDVYKKELDLQVEAYKERWKELAAKGTIDSPEITESRRTADRLVENSAIKITLEEYKRARDKHFETSVALIEAESILAAQRGEAKRLAVPGEESEPTPARSGVEQAFLADAEVVALRRQLEGAEKRVEKVRQGVRFASDPALREAKRTVQSLRRQYQQLWEEKEPVLRDRLGVQSEGGVPADPATLALESRVNSLKASKASYEKILDKIEIMKNQQGSDAVEVALIQEALSGLKEMQRAVIKRVEQLKFDAREDARIILLAPARPSNVPVSDGRKKLMAAAPIGILAMLLGLSISWEAWVGRVGNADELSARVRVETYPLPVLPARKESRQGALQIEAFVQGLDHLRVSLFGASPAAEMSHCVMITSALGGEGKTTLAAQLAARCAAAGMSTLLIDADLRRAALSRGLEAAELPGLGDVLRGDLDIDAVLVPIAASGFHLLPAGAPQDDPGRVFQGQRIGPLLARLRESFDIILIDTPPVLPVADALFLGHWTDGAILATRSASSRMNLVEQAYRRLTNAGIPVLGAVVNGVVSNTLYGSYSYARK